MKKFLLLVFMTMTISTGFSQLDSLITFSGSFDVYFRQNINATNDLTNGGTLAPATSFANLPGFAIGMANFKVAYAKEKIGLLGDFVLGPRGRDAVFNSPAGLNIVNQLYISYQANPKLSFTAGKYNTFVGYEVISPVPNVHYSTSYMFSYGPFNHTGVKANYTLGKGFSAMAAIMNPTDFTDFNPTNDFYEGIQLGYVNDKSAVYLNGLFAKDYQQYDLTATHKFSDKYSIGLNATSASNSFNGIALYNTLGVSKNVDVAARIEYFQDKGIAVLQGTNANVLDLTLSLGIKTNNARLVPEFRIDIFKNDEDTKPVIRDALTQKTSDKLSSFVLAAIANF